MYLSVTGAEVNVVYFV